MVPRLGSGVERNGYALALSRIVGATQTSKFKRPNPVGSDGKNFTPYDKPCTNQIVIYQRKLRMCVTLNLYDGTLTPIPGVGKVLFV